jgi:MinD-like ATPase involved in chromosome partitioning or flagellar assembly
MRRLRVMSSGRWHQPVPELQARRIVAVASAQPGAGKSIVASNLAAALATLGQRVVVADLDPATPRQHALVGETAAARPLDAWLDDKREAREVLPTATKVKNLRLLPYAGGVDADPRRRRERRRAMGQELYDLDGDVVVVDLGADDRDDLFELFPTRALRLVVSGGEPAALEATYAFLAGAAARAERRHGAQARTALASFTGGLVGNWTAAPEEEERFHAFSRLVREHLGIPLPVVGCLRSSDRLPQSIVARQPLVMRRGVDDNVRVFHQIADWVVTEESAPVRECALDAGDDAAATVVPVGPLPTELAAYARKHPRLPVDWTATLELAAGVTAVRVRDISASGVGAEASLALRIGDRGILHLDQLHGRPALPVVVKNVLPALKRFGLGFANPGEATARVVAIAIAKRGRPRS